MYLYLNYYSNLFFLPLLLISNLLSLMVSSWFILWILMELNLLCFIFIASSEINKKYVLMDYYLTQCLCSMIYLFSYFSFYSQPQMSGYMIIPMLLAVLSKMGIPPFHMWYMKMFYHLSWYGIYVLSVSQKVIPMVILSNMIALDFFNFYHSLIFHLVVSVIWCSLMGLMEVRLKMITVYSSVINVSWVMLILFISDVAALVYFLIYSLISLCVIHLYSTFNMVNIQDLGMLKLGNDSLLYYYSLLMFSLGGLPPFAGFMQKWIAFQELSSTFSFNCVILYIFSSIISLVFYLRNIYMVLTLSSTTIKSFSWLLEYKNMVDKYYYFMFIYFFIFMVGIFMFNMF